MARRRWAGALPTVFHSKGLSPSRVLESGDIPSTSSGDPRLASQLRYYGARAHEYDEWWLRQGRYDRGEEENARWFAEGETVARALANAEPKGDILELACGTGIWTRQLVEKADTVTAVDGSPEMLRINAQRLRSPKVEHVEADLFTWKPNGAFDFIFFSFWLSHVPPERFEPFWELVRRALVPGGRIFFVDSLRTPTSIATDHRLPDDPSATILNRRINDGREFEIYKVFTTPKNSAVDSKSLDSILRSRPPAVTFSSAAAG